jgi:RimJ/RimL family protein N-acetyltransferase
VDVPSLLTDRLELVSLGPDVLKALTGGDPEEAERASGVQFPGDWPGEHRWMFELRTGQMEKDPSCQPWLVRGIVLREDPARRVIGHINFHEPPSEGAVEIGYSIEPAYRRRGYATEAVKAMFDWAERDHGVERFIASVSPGNAASLRLTANLGFVKTGVQWDERDGEEIVFELRRGPGRS